MMSSKNTSTASTTGANATQAPATLPPPRPGMRWVPHPWNPREWTQAPINAIPPSARRTLDEVFPARRVREAAAAREAQKAAAREQEAAAAQQRAAAKLARWHQYLGQYAGRRLVDGLGRPVQHDPDDPPDWIEYRQPGASE